MRVFSVTELLSAAFAVSLVLGYGAWDRQAKRGEPVEHFFDVQNVSIPNFKEGDDPLIVYDRAAKQAAKVTRIVEVLRAAAPDGVPVCEGRNTHKYENDFTIPEPTLRLSNFVGTKCDLAPDLYIPKVLWLVQAEGYPTKRIKRIGDQFRVLPKDAQPYITDKQLDQKVQDQVQKEIGEVLK